MSAEFNKESDMCEEFMRHIPATWIAYPETGGFDILLVRKEDGFQIGIEAKLKLNAKVIAQAAEYIGPWYAMQEGPDCRAVLVPSGAGGDLSFVCRLLGIEVIRCLPASAWGRQGFYPDLPALSNDRYTRDKWFEFCPARRLKLPDYVPDTKAGDSSPITLTHWKIGAIKLKILLEKTGYLTRGDFKKLEVSISRWIQGGLLAWLQPGKIRGQWVGSERLPDFKIQHPLNYIQIDADFEKWNPRMQDESVTS